MFFNHTLPLEEKQFYGGGMEGEITKMNLDFSCLEVKNIYKFPG
jgi:hypothetical protein